MWQTRVLCRPWWQVTVISVSCEVRFCFLTNRRESSWSRLTSPHHVTASRGQHRRHVWCVAAKSPTWWMSVYCWGRERIWRVGWGMAVAIVVGFASDLQQSLQVKLVRISPAGHFGQYQLIIVISESSAHLVVVHVGSILPLAPSPGYFFRIQHCELSVRTLPADTGDIDWICKEL